MSTNTFVNFNNHATRPVRKHLAKALEDGNLQAVIDCLTDKQKSFVEEYLVDLNGLQAVIRSGYKTNNPNRMANQLLKNPGVRFAIDGLKAKRAENSDVTSDYVLKNIKEIVEKQKEDNPNAALRGLEALAKHLGMFIDRQEISGKDGEAIQFEKVKQDADELSSAITSLVDRARARGLAEVSDDRAEG